MTAQDRPFVRVYYEIIDDPKFATVYGDDRKLATWLRLLIAADAMHPAPAPIPRSVHEPTYRHLVSVGILEAVGVDHFRVHGMISERATRYAGGKGRKQYPSDVRSDSDSDSESLTTPTPIPDRRTLTSQSSPDLTSPVQPEDALDAYYALTIRYPSGRTKDWLTELANEFGHSAASRALASEWTRSTDVKTFLSRTEAHLRSEAHHAEVERAKPKPKPIVNPEEAKRLDAERRKIMAEMMVVTE